MLVVATVVAAAVVGAAAASSDGDAPLRLHPARTATKRASAPNRRIAGQRRTPQASFEATEPAARSAVPSAPSAVIRRGGRCCASAIMSRSSVANGTSSIDQK